MRTATQLYRIAGIKGDHPHGIAIFLPKQGHGAAVPGFGQGHIGIGLQGNVLAHALIYHVFYLLQLFIAELGKMAEVKAQAFIVYQRALLLHVLAQHAAQGGMQQVGSGMVILG
ncbi:hypothetical protein ADICEAN_03280 [Cesiribacter andamanensis AMV16]|uniref:Uncharacterized protein n=1 Tax=Cesiribacter andamanensis AMV16 TaxID=1279009 RepID=M7NIF4_9BACT|nr:hypothetical protein ADICEAN_03280 [Cesiribacter andamanensis AMV16]